MFLPRRKWQAFTLVEILVVLATIGILAAISFPVFSRARESARRASCQSNLKQIGLGFAQYIQDFDDYLPLANAGIAGEGQPAGWVSYQPIGNFAPERGSLFPYLKSAQIFVCPSDSIGAANRNSYATNSCAYSQGSTTGLAYHLGKSLATFEATAKWMLVGEEGSGSNDAVSTDDGYFLLSNGAGNDFTARHLSGSSLLFLDGHVKWYQSEKMKADGYQVGGTGPIMAGTNCPT